MFLLEMLIQMTILRGTFITAIHQTKPAALEVKRINVSLEIVQHLRRIARAKRTQKRFQRFMCEQMIIVMASCAKFFVAMRTLFFVDLALLPLVFGSLVQAQSTTIRKIFLALIAFVSFLFMNIPNVPQQIALLRKLCLTTTTNKSHLLLLFFFVCERERLLCLFLFLLLIKNNKQNRKPIEQSTFLQLLLLVSQKNKKISIIGFVASIQFILVLFLFALALVARDHEANCCTIQDCLAVLVAIDSHRHLAEFFHLLESTPCFEV